jgi:O-antigen ligase
MSEGPVLGAAADPWARRAILALTLVLSCVIGLITPYLLAMIGIVLWLALAFRRQLFAAYDDLAARLFLLAFVVLAACFAVTAKVPQDALFSFNFIMLVLFAPLGTLLARGASADNATRVADLALVGALVAFLAAGIGRYALNFGRAESPIFGAILLGNTAVLLGFLALPGILAPGSRRKWLYLAGPALGIGATVFTESRGPLIAVLPLLLVAAIFLGRGLKIRPLWLGLGGLAVIAVLMVGAFQFQGRIAALASIVGDLASGGTVADETTRIRLELYAAGYQAFLQSPWLGHGWANLMSSAKPFLSADYVQFAVLPQLHNDVIDFAVAAGVVGVAVYLLLIATPIIAASRSPKDSQYVARLFGCVLLVTAYVFDGLTDLMFGFEFHTALYVTLTAILLAYCRDPVVTKSKG